jgi:putative nucleotidyltransferase with HDIG domain
VLRAVRQSLAFAFHIEEQTLAWVRAAAPLLPAISAERQRDELVRILEGARVALAVRILDRVGALQQVLPELDALKNARQPPPHVEDAWEHTLGVMQALEDLLNALVGAYQEEKVADPMVGAAVLWLGRYRQQLAQHFTEVLVPERSLRSLLFLAALYHDAGKPGTAQVDQGGRLRFFEHEALGAQMAASRARALALSVAEIERVKTIVAQHMRVHQLAGVFQGDPGGAPGISRRAIYRYFNATRQAGVDICLLSLADTRGTYQASLPAPVWEAELKTCRALLEAYWEKTEEVVAPPRLLSGSDLMEAFNLVPGPEVGRLLDAIREAQATGEVQDRESALRYAQSWLAGRAEMEAALREEKHD